MQISKIVACRSGRKRVGISLGRMVGVAGIEPATSSLSGTRSNQLSYTPGCVGGGNGTRTRDIQLAKLALYQLSYAPGGLTGTGHGPFARTPASQNPCTASCEAEAARQVLHSLWSRLPRDEPGAIRPEPDDCPYLPLAGKPVCGRFSLERR